MHSVFSNRQRPKPRAPGFTLIEIVVTIVIMSVIAIGLTGFILDSASGYSTTATRNQVSAAGRIVIDRIAMELRNALPESVRLSAVRTTTDADGSAGDQCLEFVPVVAATTYLDPAFRPAARKAAFDVVDLVPAQVGASGMYATIFPRGAPDIYGATFGPGNETQVIARVNVTDGAAPNTDTLTYSRLSDNAPYDHRFIRRSPVERLFLSGQPVSYCVQGERLYRYENYGFNATQRLPLRPGGASCAAGPGNCLPGSTPNRALMTDQLDNVTLTGGSNGQAFDLLTATRRRNAVIQLELNFSRSGETVRLNHEVLMRSTP